jgi:ankyrin repeat protein
MCERNALLNLAVIHQRHKVVKWLVEVQHADVETVDRGLFTPLMNAAYAGDKYLVRFLLQKGW